MKKPQKNKTPSQAKIGNAFAWHHVRAVVPADWEITSDSGDESAGRLEFNTRHGHQGVVNWEPCSSEPDYLTAMTTFLANHIRDQDNSRKHRSIDMLTVKVGHFLMGWLDEALPCQAMGYAPESGHLIRWIFEGHSSKTDRENILRPILESCDFNADDATCEYHLYGIHCLLPRDYKVKDIVLLPADITMSFENEISKRRTTFRRWGLASMILGKRDLNLFYEPFLNALSIEVEASTPCHVSGCEGRLITFNAPREPHKDRSKRRRWQNGKAVIWHDADANRIYAFEQIGPEDSQALEFNEILLGRILEVTH